MKSRHRLIFELLVNLQTAFGFLKCAHDDCTMNRWWLYSEFMVTYVSWRELLEHFTLPPSHWPLRRQVICASPSVHL